MNSFMDDWTSKLSTLYLEDRVEDAIKLILEHWNKDTESWTRKRKCDKRALKKINKGNKLFTSVRDINLAGMVYNLLEIYTKAVAYAPNNSSELSRAYANRSAVLCEAHMYDASLKDIERALTINCQDHFKAKLYTRKAKNLSALDAERSAIEEAIADARCWMVKTNDDKMLMETRLKELNKSKSYPKPFEQLDNSVIMSDITDPNETLIGASNAIALKYSEKFGRHVVAKRDIKVGETLIKHKPYTLILPLPTYTRCWNCLKRTWASIPCIHCTIVVYCDENCRDQAWNHYHDVECLIMDYIIAGEPTIDHLMGLRLVIRALKEAGTIKLLRENLILLDSMPDLLTRGFTGDVLDSTKYASIYTLSSEFSMNDNSFSKRLTMCTFILFIWAATSEIFGKKVQRMDELINNETAIFMGRFLIKNMRIYDTNAQQIIYHNDKDITTDRLMISCLSSCFNHNCDSNAFSVHSGDDYGINSIQTIKKGEQIFISYEYCYGDLEISRRQLYYESRYNFKCECRACLGKWSYPPELELFPDQVRPGTLTSKEREIMYEFVNLFRGLTFQKQNDTIIDKISSLPLLIELLNVLYKHFYYPCHGILVQKVLLKLNYRMNSY